MQDSRAMDEDLASPVAGPSGLSTSSGPSNSSGSSDSAGPSGPVIVDDSTGNYYKATAAPLPQHCLPTEAQVINH